MWTAYLMVNFKSMLKGAHQTLSVWFILNVFFGWPHIHRLPLAIVLLVLTLLRIELMLESRA